MIGKLDDNSSRPLDTLFIGVLRFRTFPEKKVWIKYNPIGVVDILGPLESECEYE